jgi:2-dehydro-3-deoxygluconokinase
MSWLNSPSLATMGGLPRWCPTMLLAAAPWPCCGKMASTRALSKSMEKDGLASIWSRAAQARARATFSTTVSHRRSATPTPAFWDWSTILADATWFHVSGITAAVSANGAAALRDGLTAARDLGITISFDCNFRPSLWARDKRDPVPLLRDLLSFADVIFGNHNDFALLSGRRFDDQGAARRREAAETAFDLFSNLQCIASTARHIVEADKQTLSARIDRRDGHHQTPEVTLTSIVDRIGSGDAFCAGILHGLLNGMADCDTVAYGLALAVLKHSLPGDASLFIARDVDAYLAGQSDVRR